MVKKQQIGKKAENLLILNRKFPDLVPPFEIIEFRDLFTNWQTVNKQLILTAKNFLNNKLSRNKYESSVNQNFKSLKINDNYIYQLSKRLKFLGFNKVSYRTSALLEDLLSSSFAGQYLTFLDQDIDIKTIKENCRVCAESLFSSKVLCYLKKQEYLNFHQGGNVIIQKMFYGKASGVLFTENGLNQIELSYTNSWKNTTVEGSLANNCVINKNDLNPISDIPTNLPKKIFHILKAALLLEKQLKIPLDIEWAVTDKMAALLQFRPLTIKKLDYNLEWDNSNIAESYPGITLPLTYSFIKKLYSKVYPQFLKLLGKSESELLEKTDVFENMLGYIQGRVYYNINNWYKLISFLPGYKYNKEFFEVMLMPVKKMQNIKTGKKQTSFFAKLNTGYTAARFIWLLFQTNNLSKKFINNYLSNYEKYNSICWDQLSATGIIHTFNKVENNLLKQWAVPILNDFRTMVFHGILKKVFFPKNNDLYIQLLSGIYDQTSIEPIRKLGILAQNIKSILDIYKCNQEKTTKMILNNKKHHLILNYIKEYLLKYGGRSPDELKLENPRLGENLFTFVRFLVSSASGYTENRILTKSTANNNGISNIFLKPLFNFILYQTKSGISKRERFRFYRAQVFGLARNAYLALGKRFVEAKLIKQQNDIFYLNHDEIENIVLGHEFDFDLKDKIDLRKKKFKLFEKQILDRRLISSGLIAPMNITNNKSPKSINGKLTGLGVSKGIFEGKVIIAKKFDPKMNVKGKILVTEHTDPGWALLFLNASALIVERGNPLSHASIVAREIGIPAVVAVKDACSKLNNNDQVIVNGSTGEITIL